MPALIRIFLLLSTITAVLFLPAVGRAPGGPVAAGPDPLWCPQGVAPIGGAGGCSPSFTSLTALLGWLAAHDPAVPGVIWLERTYNSALEAADGFTLDGRDFSNFDRQALTIQGGWNGFGTTTINHDDPSVFNGDSLYFWYWNAPITINDVTFDHTTASGVNIDTVGDIFLSNVIAQNSLGPAGNGHGAAIWNVEGGDVVIADSRFNENSSVGLLITTSGAVRLHNITANGNGLGRIEAGGVSISNRSDGPPQDVVLTGLNVFNDNYFLGLSVMSDGAIELENVIATGNFYDPGPGLRVGLGVYLDNDSADTPRPVLITGATHYFSGNTSTALTVWSKGHIYAQNLNVVGNEAWGTYLANAGSGSGGIVLEGENTFLGNGAGGLGLWSDGMVEASGVAAKGNGQDGVFVRTPVDALVNCSDAFSNGDYGIDASGVGGALTFNDVRFDGMNASGDYVYAGTPVLDKGGCAGGGEPAPDPDAPPIDVIDIPDGGLLSLGCGQLRGIGARLPSGLSLLLDCPTVGDVVLNLAKPESLPGTLPEEFKFLSGLKVEFTDGRYSKGMPGLMEISFPNQAGYIADDLAVLYWDGKAWQDLGNLQFGDGRQVYSGGYLADKGTFDTLTNFTGLFVLVRR